MAALKLYVGNKNYSSWSMRPWVALRAAGVDFEDEVIPFDFPAGNPAIKAISEGGTVPVLEHEGLRIWETLAIVEYVAELFPDKRLWPAERRQRALARAYCSEMATGFRALRNAAPMNLRYPRKKLAVDEDVAANIRRIEAIWHGNVEESGGPFLFGDFCAADAFFAPVVARFDSYLLVDHPATLRYMEAVKKHPAMQAWAADAAKETWIVPEDEL
ncbi:MAG: glutathione S-transferase family protein [Rhizobium sp.]|nr:glutathione S-transferase family protein [Rhizobium sp.]MBX9457093.1 glutathione S-transferase family protein [Rhizobium sp.]